MAEREAISEAARAFERLEAEIRGRATKKLPAARNHDTATQNKARARREPSPRPPASKTEARPLGHQPRTGTQRKQLPSKAVDLTLCLQLGHAVVAFLKRSCDGLQLGQGPAKRTAARASARNMHQILQQV